MRQLASGDDSRDTAVPCRPRRQPAATRRRCSRRERGTPPARSTPTRCAPSEDAAHPRCRPHAGGRRAAARRPTASSAGRRGTWTSSTSSAASTRTDEKLTVHFRNEQGDLDFESAALKVHDRVTLTDTIFGDAFRFLRETASPAPDAEADHPVAEHGALPRRSGRDRPGRLPRARGVLVRPHAALRRRGTPARGARLHLPPARRHQPGLPQRPRSSARMLAEQGADAEHQHETLHPQHQRRARATARTA